MLEWCMTYPLYTVVIVFVISVTLGGIFESISKAIEKR